VERAAAEAGAPAVEAVGLRVGARSGVVPEALVGAWPVATAGTRLAGARLDLDLVPAAIWCPGCVARREVDAGYALVCPACGTPSGDLVQGRDLAVAWADLADPAPADPADPADPAAGPDPGPPHA
jgi:hydrogenase nickel incorporation protein HypA/HybF